MGPRTPTRACRRRRSILVCTDRTPSQPSATRIGSMIRCWVCASFREAEICHAGENVGDLPPQHRDFAVAQVFPDRRFFDALDEKVFSEKAAPHARPATSRRNCAGSGDRSKAPSPSRSLPPRRWLSHRDWPFESAHHVYLLRRLPAEVSRRTSGLESSCCPVTRGSSGLVRHDGGSACCDLRRVPTRTRRVLH
jgi:hypothetical protein